jgi:isoquinoline 1-oxidoreductase alpha subunit
MPIKLTVNGTPQNYDGDPAQPLLWYLRDELHLTGTKYGCGIAACGACTVHVNGTAVQSCVVPMTAAANAKVTTIEGLSANGDHPVQKAWADANVPQCGYCQPGQMMAAASLIKKKGKPTEADIDEAMSLVICRCGTYSRIREALKAAAGMTTSTTGGR